MKPFLVFCYAVVCAATVVGFAGCEQTAVSDAENGSAAGEPQQANRRSIGEYHGLYEPSYYAPHYHAHGLHAAAPDHYHLQATAAGYYGPARFQGVHGYAPGHYHYDLQHHETAVHGGFRQRPIVYQSVVNAYPTATTVVHRPVPVPVAHPVPVPVARPVPVEVPRPYPVPVNRPYPVAVVRPVPVPVAQPYPVTVYRPYPVPVYRPLLPAATVVRPTAVRVPLSVRPYPAQPAATSYVHSHRVYAPPPRTYAPHYHGTYAPHYHGAYPSAASTYLQQLAAVRAVAGGGGGGGGVEFDVNDAAAATAQQQTFQEDYSYANEQQEAAVAADGRHHDDLGQFRHESAIGEDAGGYPSLTADDTFKTSLGVPSTDYAGKK